MRYFLTCALLIATSQLLHAHPSLTETYTYNPKVAPNTWENLSPFFLPEDHPAKHVLDTLLDASRVRSLKNTQALKHGGFQIIQKGTNDHVFVVSHPDLEGYLLKLYTETQSCKRAFFRFQKRIIGAQMIQDLLNQHSLNHLFKVPKKWLYPLPVHPRRKRSFVLVVENVHPFKKLENERLWKSPYLTEELLKGLYLILKEGGLQDSTYLFNIPFSKDDYKIAFLDTEDHSHWPIPFSRIGAHLSPSLKKFWMALTKTRNK